MNYSVADLFMSTPAGIVAQEHREQKVLVNSSKLPVKYNGNRNEEEEYLNKLNQMGITVLDEKDDLFMKVILPEGWKVEPTDHSMWSDLVDNNGRKRASIFYKGAFYDRDAFISFNRRFRLNGKVADYNEKDFEKQPEYIVSGTKKVWVDENGREVTRKKVMEYQNSYDCEYVCHRTMDGRYFTEDARFHQEDRKVYVKNPEYKYLSGYEKYMQPFHYEVHDFDGTILFKSDVVKTYFKYYSDHERHFKFFRHLDRVEKKAKDQCIAWLNEHYPDWQNDLAYWDI